MDTLPYSLICSTYNTSRSFRIMIWMERSVRTMLLLCSYDIHDKETKSCNSIKSKFMICTSVPTKRIFGV